MFANVMLIITFAKSQVLISELSDDTSGEREIAIKQPNSNGAMSKTANVITFNSFLQMFFIYKPPMFFYSILLIYHQKKILLSLIEYRSIHCN